MLGNVFPRNGPEHDVSVIIPERRRTLIFKKFKKTTPSPLQWGREASVRFKNQGVIKVGKKAGEFL